MILISPSILASDFANLEREVRAIAKDGADLAHVDVMDGHFVPNITIGVPVVQSLKKISPIPLDVHLMISDPLTFVPAFAKAGSDIITFHLECDCDVQKTIDAIRESGAKVGVSLKPKTAAEAVFPFLDQIDMVLVMTVEPGFGGQSFMSDMLPKISAIRQRVLEIGRTVDIQVDGGIDPTTAPLVAKAGANVLVAGSAVFRHENYAEPIAAIRKAAETAL
ncbi:ribulose-phosphate 3-epimerase [Oscillospiraceae bacterium LTW-04]|nr:ribulose-phosphate 3-epimerase [Oscillospiraceae bacterium MB24-C1]